MPIKIKLTKDENGNIKDIVLNPKTMTIEKQVWESTLNRSMVLEAENARLKEELKDYEYQHKQDGICYNDIFCKLELARKENKQLKTDCHTLAQKLLQVKPELREWLEVNYGEYL